SGAADQPARPGSRTGTAASRCRPPGLPLLQCHTRQYRCAPGTDLKKARTLGTSGVLVNSRAAVSDGNGLRLATYAPVRHEYRCITTCCPCHLSLRHAEDCR